MLPLWQNFPVIPNVGRSYEKDSDFATSSANAVTYLCFPGRSFLQTTWTMNYDWLSVSPSLVEGYNSSVTRDKTVVGNSYMIPDP
jgi:hypothetical protein